MKLFSRRSLITLIGAVAFAVTALGLTGCEMGSIQLSGALPGGPTTGVAVSGIVHGGQYPIYGSQIQLYVAGAPAAPTTGSPTGGLGQGATALITPGSGLGFSNNYTPGSNSATCNWTTGNPNNCTVLPSTGTSGQFSITGDYLSSNCPSTGETYIVATGGDSDGTGTFSTNNTAIALMAALGPCSGLSASTNIILNEVTTVAAVYSLNQFMAAPATGTGVPASSYTSQGGATAGIGVNIGASSGPVGGYGPGAVQTQQIGLTNAFSMVNNLSDYSQGSAVPVAGNTWATPYTQMTNTIADILAACVNTTASNSANCTNLFSYAKPSSVSYIPADTIQATWMMARYPQGVNVASLYTLVTATGAGDPFTNNLSSAPNQYTIEVGFQPATSGANSLLAATGCSSTNGTNGTNCAISNPITGAFDEYGDLWIYNLNPQSTAGTTTAPQTKSFVTEIAPNGAFLNGPFNSYTAHGGYQVASADPCSTGYTHYLSYGTGGQEGIAIDQNNVVWVTNSQEYTGAESSLTCGTTSLATSAFSVMRITGSNTSGTAALATGYYSKNAIGALAVDSADNIWVAESNGNLSSAGFPIATFTNSGTFATGGFNIFQSIGVAIDTAGGATGSGITSATSGNVWAGSTYTCGSYGVLNESPTSSASAPTLTGSFYGTGVTCTAGVLDSPTQQVNNGAGLGNPYAVAVDKNNGIWVPNYKNAQSSSFGPVSYSLPTSNTWVNSGTQAAPNTTTPVPSTAATDAQSYSGQTYGYGNNNPGWIAVDGSNIAWVANLSSSFAALFQVALGTGPSITSVTTPSIVGGGASGLKLPGGANPLVPSAGTNWVGIDPSGNVWFLSAKAQSNGATTQTNYATVVVGAATPVITPLAFQVQYNRIGQTPQ